MTSLEDLPPLDADVAARLAEEGGAASPDELTLDLEGEPGSPEA
jgi:hypothetical protein